MQERESDDFARTGRSFRERRNAMSKIGADDTDRRFRVEALSAPTGREARYERMLAGCCGPMGKWDMEPSYNQKKTMRGQRTC